MRSNKKCASITVSVSKGNANVWILYKRVKVICPTLKPALRAKTATPPKPGKSSSNASGTAVTILQAQKPTWSHDK